ncbi:MAG: hypothetical protein U0136_18990 [Bdellovibrionota bacterium]
MLDRRTEDLLDQDMLLQLHRSTPGFSSDGVNPHCPDGWRYHPSSISQLVNLIGFVGQALQLVLAAFCGGKFFGQLLMDVLLRRLPDDTREMFRVPPWTMCVLRSAVPTGPIAADLSNLVIDEGDEAGWEEFCRQIEEWRKRTDEGADSVIARSSKDREDWLDPAAGAESSHVYHVGSYCPSISSSRIADLSDPRKMASEMEKLRRHPHLLQIRDQGVGLVFDVAYSYLLQRPVVRVAHGRILQGRSHGPDGEIFTSPTWDGWSSCGIWDPAKSEWICPLTTPLGGRAVALYIPVVERFITALMRLVEPLNFGVQVEACYVPAANQTQMSLLQIRPTPEVMRGASLIRRWALGKEIVLETPVVGRPVATAGEVVILDQWAMEDYTTIGRGIFEKLRYPRPEGDDVTDKRPDDPSDVCSRIVLADIHACPRGLQFLHCMAGLQQAHASAFIGPNAVTGWMHEANFPPEREAGSDPAAQRAVKQLFRTVQELPIFGVDSADAIKLRRTLAKKEVCVNSDGLVGWIMV